MSHSVRYPTEVTFKGPWWLTLESLTELEAVVDAEWERWKSAEDQRAAKLNQYQQASDIESPYRRLTVQLKDGRSVGVASFVAADRLPDLQTAQPVGFSLSMRRAGRTWRLELSQRWNELEVKASPPDSEGAEFLNSIRRWRDSHGPSALRSGLSSFPWNLIVVVAVAAVLFVLSGSTRVPTPQQDERAAELLSNGLSQDEISAAVALLLESQFSPRRVQPPSGLRLSLFAVVVALFALDFVWPSVVLGLGRGRRALQKWRFVDRAVFWGVPMAILAALRPVFEAQVRSIFGF